MVVWGYSVGCLLLTLMGVGLDTMHYKLVRSHRWLLAYKFILHLFFIWIWELITFSDECLGSGNDEGCSEVR